MSIGLSRKTSHAPTSESDSCDKLPSPESEQQVYDTSRLPRRIFQLAFKQPRKKGNVGTQSWRFSMACLLKPKNNIRLATCLNIVLQDLCFSPPLKLWWPRDLTSNVLWMKQMIRSDYVVVKPGKIFHDFFFVLFIVFIACNSGFQDTKVSKQAYCN